MMLTCSGKGFQCCWLKAWGYQIIIFISQPNGLFGKDSSADHMLGLGLQDVKVMGYLTTYSIVPHPFVRYPRIFQDPQCCQDLKVTLEVWICSFEPFSRLHGPFRDPNFELKLEFQSGFVVNRRFVFVGNVCALWGLELKQSTLLCDRFREHVLYHSQ